MFGRKAVAAPKQESHPYGDPDFFWAQSEDRKIHAVKGEDDQIKELLPEDWALMNITYAIQPGDLDDSWVKQSGVIVPGDPIITKLRTILRSAAKGCKLDPNRYIEVYLDREDGTPWGTQSGCTMHLPEMAMTIRPEDVFGKDGKGYWAVFKRAIQIRKTHAKWAGHPEGYDTLHTINVKFFYQGESPIYDGRLRVFMHPDFGLQTVTSEIGPNEGQWIPLDRTHSDALPTAFNVKLK